MKDKILKLLDIWWLTILLCVIFSFKDVIYINGHGSVIANVILGAYVAFVVEGVFALVFATYRVIFK